MSLSFIKKSQKHSSSHLCHSLQIHLSWWYWCVRKCIAHKTDITFAQLTAIDSMGTFLSSNDHSTSQTHPSHPQAVYPRLLGLISCSVTSFVSFPQPHICATNRGQIQLDDDLLPRSSRQIARHQAGGPIVSQSGWGRLIFLTETARRSETHSLSCTICIRLLPKRLPPHSRQGINQKHLGVSYDLLVSTRMNEGFNLSIG